MDEQSIQSKKGEVEFRKKLYQLQVQGEAAVNDEFKKDDIERLLAERMQKTLLQMTVLKNKGILSSPYLEIGAERCQRSLVMENDLGESGAASDISYYSLKSCDYYLTKFNKARAPLRICCDVYNLPIMTNSIPFIFCYETLHHFPDPGPVLQQINRVLMPGGYFYFDEEPYKVMLHLNLYTGNKIYSKEALKSSRWRQVVDFFFARPSCNEIEHGIIENHQMSIQAWKQTMGVFDDVRLKLNSIRTIEVDLSGSHSALNYLIAWMFGGHISGICRKNGKVENKPARIEDSLICPACLEKGEELKLVKENLSFRCGRCSAIYPIVDGVIFLFTGAKFEELYPEIYKSCCH